MKLASIATEAWRNFATAPGRSLGLGGALGLVLLLLTLADLWNSASLIEAAKRFQNSGGATTVLVAEGGVDGRACDRLTEIPGIRAAGALRKSPDLKIAVLPSTGIPAYDVSPGFSELILGSAPEDIGVLVSESLASDLSASVGGLLAVDEKVTRVAGIFPYPADGRRAELEYAVLLPSPATGPFDQCWVAAWPIPNNISSIARLSLAPDLPTDAQLETRQLNSTLGTDFDGEAMYAARPFGLAPIVATVAGALLALGITIRRRIELAAALHARVPRVALSAQLVVEAFLITLAPTMISIAAVVGATGSLASGDSTALRIAGVGVVLCGASGFALGLLVSSLFVREANLFRFFKSR